MRLIHLVLLFPLALAACSENLDIAERDRPLVDDGTPTLVLDETETGFEPIRPATLQVPGSGTWVCTPAGAGMVSQCAQRGDNVASLEQSVTPPNAPATTGTVSPERVESILNIVRNNPPEDSE